MSKNAATSTEPQILSTAQAARELCVSPRTLLHWINKGRIEAQKTGPGTAGFVITRDEVNRVKAEVAAA